MQCELSEWLTGFVVGLVCFYAVQHIRFWIENRIDQWKFDRVMAAELRRIHSST